MFNKIKNENIKIMIISLKLVVLLVSIYAIGTAVVLYQGF